MAIYRCYLFDARFALLRENEFGDERSARHAAAAALFWEDCDHVEVWEDHRKIIAWQRCEKETDLTYERAQQAGCQ